MYTYTHISQDSLPQLSVRLFPRAGPAGVHRSMLREIHIFLRISFQPPSESEKLFMNFDLIFFYFFKFCRTLSRDLLYQAPDPLRRNLTVQKGEDSKEKLNYVFE